MIYYGKLQQNDRQLQINNPKIHIQKHFSPHFVYVGKAIQNDANLVKMWDNRLNLTIELSLN